MYFLTVFGVSSDAYILMESEQVHDNQITRVSSIKLQLYQTLGQSLIGTGDVL